MSNLFDESPIREPVTLEDRVAYALCEFDLTGAEGRMTDGELASLETLLDAVMTRCPTPETLGKFLCSTAANEPDPAAVGKSVETELRRFVFMEQAMRDPVLGNSALYRIIEMDWPNYRAAAKAVMRVLSAERRAREG